jgi:DNA-binding IclR family transcriptional regulator
MSERDYDVPAVRKAIRLIELLCESPRPLGISEISQQLDMNKNMVFRQIRTLTDLGWVVADHEDNLKYRMTLLPFQHASKPVSRMNVRQAALDPLRTLWEQTQKSCYLCIPERRRALCVEHFDSTGVLRIHAVVGGRYYLNATAPGKVLLAYDDTGLADQLTELDLPSLTPNTITDKARLLEHLADVARRGYAIDDRENAEGVICYAVPIWNYDGRVAGALGLSSLTFDCSLDEMIRDLGPLVEQAGQAASRTLGAPEKVLAGQKISSA